MQDFEKLGAFYLGRPYDLQKKKPKEGLLLYDSKDLVTHAVCVGMTGSGKTGLCLALLEEAAIDGIPALIIDPKGDLANLLLTFPNLQAEDFATWINEDDARKKGLSPAEYAGQQAALWKKGLGEWGQSGERIKRLREAADYAIYTPGSNAGLQVSILKSFAAPAQSIIDDSDLLRERISTTVTSLLGLLGIEADPIRSREHILISTILDSAWKENQDLDLAALIQHIQKPPVSKVGVLDLESFYPSKDRFALAMLLNNLLAAPGFETWLEGEALDLDRLLHTPAGKPRVSIFSIAHLNDAERMFFVSLLLNQTLGWMRTQSGTTSLRAIVYMDEIFGYFPPVATPPSKAPLLTLLKQARAFGVGVVLATQNPVDLDYKGLANTGTWFIGRLQTERDKARVLEGLEGASAGAGKGFDRQKMEQILAGLGNRIFLMNNVHDDAPEIFETRWAMSYLRGPLTRNQIKMLMDERKAGAVTSSGSKAAAASSSFAAATTSSRLPVLPPDIPQYFVPIRGSQPEQSALVYQPMILGASTVRFVDAKTKMEVAQEGVFATPITDEAVPVNWESAVEHDVAISDLEKSPGENAQFATLPVAAGKAKSYDAWSKDFAKWLFASRKVELFKSPALKEVSQPGEPERDFRIRLQQSSREQRDARTEQLKQKYAPKIVALEERIRRAQQAVEREAEQAKHQQLQTAISFGTTLLGAFLGRKAISTATIGRATTAARGVGRAMKEREDVGRATETVEALQQQLADLEAGFKVEAETLTAKIDPLTETLETVVVRPKKADVSVRFIALAWMPHWQDAQGKTTPAWK
jgi:hypothetical protein